MSEIRRIDPARRRSQTAVLDLSKLDKFELAELVTQMREAKDRAPSYPIFRDVREIYLEARAAFIRKFFEAKS